MNPMETKKPVDFGIVNGLGLSRKVCKFIVSYQVEDV